MKKLILVFTVLLLTFAFIGCDEELLRRLPPEQRQYVIDMLKLYSEDSPELQALLESAQAQEVTSPPVDSASSNIDSNVNSTTQTSRNLITAYSLIKLSQDDQCSTLIDTAPRGLACLHCMSDGARDQAEILTTLMFRSCLKNVAMNVLTDGTFGFDAEFLTEQVGLLTTGGRKLYLQLYLTNGPTQRRFSSTPINSFGTRNSPSEFRERIRNDEIFRGEYRKLVERVLPVIAFAVERGADVLVVPALEDNLDQESFEAILRLTKEVIPDSSNIHYGRNSCAGCASGSDDYVPSGVFSEDHITSSHIDRNAYVITNDGRTYSFNSDLDSSSSDSLDLSSLAQAREQAAENGAIFILWKGERQGIYDSSSFSIHPDVRDYEMPSFEERRAIINFLTE